MTYPEPGGAVLPPEPDLEPIHQRQYQVRAWRVDDRSMLLRGAVEDRKPGQLFPGDPGESMVMHHMVVDLTVGYPDLTITRAEVRFETHPHAECTRIADHYLDLVGLSIARGFTHRVRELFGGPRGCTHTTALLQAMAPVAVQCMWSMRLLARGGGSGLGDGEPQSAMMRDTCHVWAGEGEFWGGLQRGESVSLPTPVLRRLAAAGVEVDDWQGA